ncbi:30S ribosomal protein S9, partial [Xanthomonas citri pv. citri]|nr:30S ribosomal protein S9 [Xanthomonas citri pv. citri]
MSINENDDVELTSYTSESTATAEAPAASERPAMTVPGSAVGRRKEAVARVRLIPGSGQWTINGH